MVRAFCESFASCKCQQDSTYQHTFRLGPLWSRLVDVFSSRQARFADTARRAAAAPAVSAGASSGAECHLESVDPGDTLITMAKCALRSSETENLELHDELQQARWKNSANVFAAPQLCHKSPRIRSAMICQDLPISVQVRLHQRAPSALRARKLRDPVES